MATKAGDPVNSSTYLFWTSDGTAGGAPRFVKFDVVLSEKHSNTSEITEHPVEIGSNIADHVRHNLDMITLEVLVANSPLSNDDLTYRNERSSGDVGVVPLDYSGFPSQPKPSLLTPGGLFGAVEQGISSLFGLGQGQPAGANALSFTRDASSAQVVFEELRLAKLNATVMQVYTPFRIYEDMLIIGVEIPRSQKDGDSLTMTISLKHLRRVQSKLVAAPAPSKPAATKIKDKGKQDGEGTKPPEKTALKAGVDAALNYFGKGPL